MRRSLKYLCYNRMLLLSNNVLVGINFTRMVVAVVAKYSFFAAAALVWDVVASLYYSNSGIKPVTPLDVHTVFNVGEKPFAQRASLIKMCTHSEHALNGSWPHGVFKLSTCKAV